MLEAIKYRDGRLLLLDQLQLPHKTFFFEVKNISEAWEAITKMKVRGAPAIAIVAALSLAVELQTKVFGSKHLLHDYVCTQMRYLATSRPTAVNLQRLCDHVIEQSHALIHDNGNVEAMQISLVNGLEKLMDDDLMVNKHIGEKGGRHMLEVCGSHLSVLTHCNTGSLATAGYGTALGVIRWLHEQKNVDHVYCTETRPYNQGARLTAYELVHDQIPATLICDSAVAALMKRGKVSCVVVGADRVVANGDTANKIGTYQIAICAKHHGIPFYVACPRSSFDFSLENGDQIPIEERSAVEMTTINAVPIAALGINCWNPGFDITPAELITGGIITECGVFPPELLKGNQDLLSHFDLYI